MQKSGKGLDDLPRPRKSANWRTCPACGGQQYDYRYNRPGRMRCICGQCGHVWAHVTPEIKMDEIVTQEPKTEPQAAGEEGKKSWLEKWMG